MDRRTKERLDLQLVCRIGSRKVFSALRAHGTLLTENLSRTGILLRWLPGVAVPSIGSKLTVDVGLPAAKGATPRAMRCSAQVVRIERKSDECHLVGVTVGKIRFIEPDPVLWADLKSMPSASKLLN